jgi:hypothetical protein
VRGVGRHPLPWALVALLLTTATGPASRAAEDAGSEAPALPGTATSRVAWVNGLAVRLGFAGPHELGCAWRPGREPTFLIWLTNRGTEPLRFGPRDVTVEAEGGVEGAVEVLRPRERPASARPPLPRAAADAPPWDPVGDTAREGTAGEWEAWGRRLRRARLLPGERVEGLVSATPPPWLPREYVVRVRLAGEELLLRFRTDLVAPPAE